MTCWNHELPLHTAIKKNDVGEVKKLLGQESNVEGQRISVSKINKFGQNAFHIAALEGSAEILELLLNIDSSLEVLDVQDEVGRTPFLYASRHNANECATLLLARGVNINMQDSLKNTALHYTFKDENDSMFEFLLRNKADLNIKGSSEQTVLYLALKLKSLDVVNLLLSKGAEPINGDELNLAIRTGSLELVQKIFEKDTCGTARKENPLSVAVTMEREDIVKLLLNRSEAGHYCLEALKLAIKNDSAQIAKHLLAYDPSYNYPEAFSYALECDNFNAVKYIVKKEPNSVNWRCYMGDTVLPLVVIKSKFEIVEFILEHLDIEKLRSLNKYTQLFQYVLGNPDSHRILNILMEKKVKGYESTDAPSRLLFLAVKNFAYDQVVEIVKKWVDMDWILVGPWLGYYSGKHYVSKHFCARPFHLTAALKIVKKLVESGFDINKKHQDQNSIEYPSEIIPELTALLCSFSQAEINPSLINPDQRFTENIDQILQTKDGLLAGANIWFAISRSDEAQRQDFAQDVLSKLPSASSNLQNILKRQNEHATELRKETNKVDGPPQNSLLQELIDKAFDDLYDGRNLYNRAMSMKEKIDGAIQGVLDANPLEEILSEIRDSNKIIISPISGVIQTSIDQWSKVLGEGESKLPPILSKLEGNDKGVCSEICSYPNFDEVKVFLDAFSFRIKPIISNKSSTSNLVEDKVPKRAKKAHSKKIDIEQETDHHIDYTAAASSSGKMI